jgi:hypothetical protein
MIGARGYEVRVSVHGELTPSWSSFFGGASLALTTDGATTIEGRLPDQAAVHGLLVTIRDLGLSLISIRVVALDGATRDEGPPGPAPAVVIARGEDAGRG